jgi:hypothetical protein
MIGCTLAIKINLKINGICIVSNIVVHFSQPYGHNGYGHPGQYFYGYSVSITLVFR